MLLQRGGVTSAHLLTADYPHVNANYPHVKVPPVRSWIIANDPLSEGIPGGGLRCPQVPGGNFTQFIAVVMHV